MAEVLTETREMISQIHHAIQSIYLESGNHNIEIVFDPDSFFFYKNIAWASVSIIYLIIAFSLLLSFKKNNILKK